MKNIILFIVAALFLNTFVSAQQVVSGRVEGNKKEKIIGATIYWAGTTIAVYSDENGMFSIRDTAISNKFLVASYVGCKPDTLVEFNPKHKIVFKLQPSTQLATVEVKAFQEGISIMRDAAAKTERISQLELRKAACCDLAGCFETQLSVQPQTTNVITNSKELRILGLSGVYNQVLVDGFPMIQGLSYTYGISSIPGTLVDNIFVSKGANSVLQGYESISGQINVITKSPESKEKVLANVYLNSFGESQYNANYSFGKGKWHNIAALHSVQAAKKIDRDKDGFLDLPQLTRYSFFNRWKYGNEQKWGWYNSVAIKLLQEKRQGGQLNYLPELHKGSIAIYGQEVVLSQPEIFTKTAFRFNDQNAVALYLSAFSQEQNSWFGTARYQANQVNVYSNLQYEYRYKKNDIKAGFSFRYLRINEQIEFSDTTLHRTYDGNYLKTEQTPGFFAEHSMLLAKEKITWVAGIRGDWHNIFGFRFTPRSLLKWDIGKQTTARASIGTGWRTVNFFSENISLLSSSRNIFFGEQIKPESAINSGINLIQKIGNTQNKFSGTLSIDFYHTRFFNQIFPDYDIDPTWVLVKNFSGKSISNGFQAELSMRLGKMLELKTGYNFLDVYQEKNNGKIRLPFNARHKILNTVSFKPIENRLFFDVNIHWFGSQRLPNTQNNPELYRRPDFSQPYTTFNAQITYKKGRFEWYGGCENIFNFRQSKPIIGWQNPFSEYFDTSSVWGPTRGREFYVGVRYLVNRTQ